MAKKTRTVLQPQYVKNFQCIGAACEENCCIGWQVSVDVETYKRYRDCQDWELRKKLDKFVSRNRTSTNEANYGKIKINREDATCPFLNNEHLCEIQKKLGEPSLSATCTSFPRIYNEVNEVLEKSLTMSCPEAARMALLNPGMMEFDELNHSMTTRGIVIKRLRTDVLSTKDKPQRYFWELRIFIIMLLQKREYSLWKRLIILGLFCNGVDDMIRERKIKEIPAYIETYVNYLASAELTEYLESIPNDLNIQSKLMQEIIEQRISLGFNSQRFAECVVEFIHGTGYTDESDRETLVKRYREAYGNYYLPIMNQYEYILENYLVNYAFKTLFPFSSEEAIFDNYMMLVIHYAMIKMLLIGIAGFHKEKFGIEQIINLIQSFSKSVEHNKVYLTEIADMLRNNGMNTMPYMAILIKN